MAERKAIPAPSNRTRLWFAKREGEWVSCGTLVDLFEVPGGVVHVHPLNQQPMRVSPTLAEALAQYPNAYRSREDAHAASFAEQGGAHA